MQKTTINNKTMQRSNLANVLRTIHATGGISRRDVAAQTGLTPSTVTNIVAKLIADGLVEETDGGEANAAVGRRPIQLSVKKDRYAIVGVELSADRIIAVITDFSGAPLAQAEGKNSGANAPAAAVKLTAALIEKMLFDACVEKARVLGVGLLSSGPYDRETGTVFDPPNFVGWHDVPLRALLEEALGLPVYFDRDSVGCALDAMASGCAQNETLFAIMVNTIGIGGAMVINGEVFYGLHNCAAEIGCMTVIADGPRCRCGDYGCLEAVACEDGILRYIREKMDAGAPDPFDGCAEAADTAMLARAYRAGKPLAVEAAEYGARYIGLAIGNVIKIACPDVIAMGGSMLSAFPEYYDRILAYATARRQAQPRFIPFRHGRIQCAMGGVRLVLMRYFSMIEG